MIEFIGITTCLLIFLIFSFFPLQVGISNKFLSNYKFFKYDLLLINLLINFILLLFLSFTKINLVYYFYIFSILINNFNVFLLFKNEIYFKNFKDINFLFL